MEALIPIVLFLVIFGIFYLYITARNRERMAIIEKGTEFDLTILDTKRKFDFKGLFFRLGFLSVGVGLGIIVGMVVEATMYSTFHRQIYISNKYIYTQNNSIPLYFSMVFIFGGLGLIIGYLVGRKKED